MQLRRKAKLHGADEAVLLTPTGFVNEGALSSIVWWRGDVLCSTPFEGAKWLPSITRDLVFNLANDMGKETKLEFATPESLFGTEVWVLSSLQGIKPASGIVIGQEFVDFSVPTRAEAFQKRLRLLASSIDS
jgi:branched-subunit amino acid aminotransferase/4-amino-4-deoxychorismate lyase